MGFNAIDFELNIDDSDDFDLSSSENSKRFGSPLSQKALDQAISDHNGSSLPRRNPMPPRHPDATCCGNTTSLSRERPAMSCPCFARTRGALDARMKKLAKEGVGTETMQAQPLTPEQEEKLWCLGIFSLCTGWGLTMQYRILVVTTANSLALESTDP